MDMGGGVAIRISSPGLEAIRDELAEDFRGLLTAQDTGRWAPHVTIQNKVEQRVARRLLRAMREGFQPRPIGVTGLHLVRYLDGGWESVTSWRFR